MIEAAARRLGPFRREIDRLPDAGDHPTFRLANMPE